MAQLGFPDVLFALTLPPRFCAELSYIWMQSTEGRVSTECLELAYMMSACSASVQDSSACKVLLMLAVQSAHDGPMVHCWILSSVQHHDVSKSIASVCVWCVSPSLQMQCLNDCLALSCH